MHHESECRNRAFLRSTPNATGWCALLPRKESLVLGARQNRHCSQERKNPCNRTWIVPHSPYLRHCVRSRTDIRPPPALNGTPETEISSHWAFRYEISLSARGTVKVTFRPSRERTRQATGHDLINNQPVAGLASVGGDEIACSRWPLSFWEIFNGDDRDLMQVRRCTFPTRGPRIRIPLGLCQTYPVWVNRHVRPVSHFSF